MGEVDAFLPPEGTGELQMLARSLNAVPGAAPRLQPLCGPKGKHRGLQLTKRAVLSFSLEKICESAFFSE